MGLGPLFVQSGTGRARLVRLGFLRIRRIHFIEGGGLLCEASRGNREYGCKIRRIAIRLQGLLVAASTIRCFIKTLFYFSIYQGVLHIEITVPIELIMFGEPS